MQLKHFERGEVLFREGEAGREAYRIVSGHVGITITEGSRTSQLGILYPGEILGEMAMIEEKPRAATARALTATVVEVITEENFMEVVVQDPERLKAYLGTLFERLRGMGVRLRQAIRAADSDPLGHSLSGDSRVSSDASRDGDTLESVMLDTTRALTLQGEQGGAPFEIRVESFPFRIGRRLPSQVPALFAANDLYVEDLPPYQVSRNHCSIERTPTGFLIEDRGSKMGTIVNGVAIGEGNSKMSIPLRRGENWITLGSPESRIRLRALV